MKIDTDKFRVRPGARVKLKRYDPASTGGLKSPAHAEERLKEGIERLAELQQLLYAQDRHALLLIFQAMDAAGKDSAIKHVMSGLNPQGTQVTSFKVPSDEELSHDFMWRTMKALPERGRIGVFNRSYYEEVLVVRVHPEILARQRLPKKLVTKRIWEDRFQDIRAVERYLSRNGTVIRKFFLHVSKKEQRRRFLERLDHREKNWKFSAIDIAERELWNDYMKAYEEALSATSSDHAPWFIIPADHKWFTHLAIAEILIETLEDLKLKVPALPPAEQRELAKARRWLTSGADKGRDEKSRKDEKARKARRTKQGQNSRRPGQDSGHDRNRVEDGSDRDQAAARPETEEPDGTVRSGEAAEAPEATDHEPI